MPTTASTLWDNICLAAERGAKHPSPKPKRPTPAEESARERALIEALCGGMTRWTDDAQIFIIHHWRCSSCGTEGLFPNMEPGRLVRRHNRAGTQWTTHDRHPISTTLPREFQHHHHATAWCPNCTNETSADQYALPIDAQFLPPTHISPGSATRPRQFV